MQSPPAVVGAGATCEVHSLVCSRDVVLYLAAVKSLVQRWDALRFVVHDDGSLDARAVSTLQEHVRGVEVVSALAADARVADTLRPFPLVAALRRENVRLRQLVDYHVLAETDAVIGMDSDIVVLNRPDEVIDWAEGNDPRTFLYSPEYGWQPMGPHWLPEGVPGFPFVEDLCCGFVCARRGFVDLAYLEELIAVTAPPIRHHGRFVCQMYYSLLAGRLGPEDAASLGERYRAGRMEWLPARDDRVVYHYFASHERASVEESLAEEAERIVQGVCRGPSAEIGPQRADAVPVRGVVPPDG